MDNDESKPEPLRLVESQALAKADVLADVEMDRRRMAAVVEALKDEDRRHTLVNYWFETESRGWVEPDWERIANTAVGAWEANR